MKNKLFFVSAGLIFCIATSGFISCSSTFQEDRLSSTELSAEILNSIADFESIFIQLDSDYYFSGKLDTSKLADFNSSEFHSRLEEKISESYEPAILARLQALDGLLYLMENKTKKADSLLKEAKGNQAKDSYVIILESRFEKKADDSLEKIQKYLDSDKNNGLLLLEKAKLLYKLQQYNNAIAAFDSSYLLFDSSSSVNYREAYEPLRNSAWSIYSSGIIESSELKTNISTNDITKPLSKEMMVELTKDKSNLLDNLSTGNTGKSSTNELVKKLSTNGYFSASTDKNNEKGTSSAVMNASAISRIIAARFLWNLYVENKNKPELLNRYSNRYAKKENAVSPISDVQIDNVDFDAAMGLVENEIINLADGKNFYPNEVITGLDYLGYLQKLKD
ncbi:MAG: S-layer homology domain-containing protein [Treponema sp.]|nr:S-layer homology domain-containing protein [Treponema sp.]